MGGLGGELHRAPHDRLVGGRAGFRAGFAAIWHGFGFLTFALAEPEDNLFVIVVGGQFNSDSTKSSTAMVKRQMTNARRASAPLAALQRDFWLRCLAHPFAACALVPVAVQPASQRQPDEGSGRHLLKNATSAELEHKLLSGLHALSWNSSRKHQARHVLVLNESERTGFRAITVIM